MRLTKFNPETGLYEYKESAKTQAEYNEQRKAVIQKLGEIEDKEDIANSATTTADVVEVVRCRDCEWWTKQADSAQGRCVLMGIYPTGAWYCGNGRRENDNT